MPDYSMKLKEGESYGALEGEPILRHSSRQDLEQDPTEPHGRGTPRLNPPSNAPYPSISGGTSILGQAHWVAVGKLTPGLIHEINNALCVLSNYVQLLMLEGERRCWDNLKPLGAMSHTIEQVQALTHRVAGYVRQSAQSPSRIKVNDLLEEVLALATLQRAVRELHIDRVPADNVFEIEADPGPLVDAFVELLTIAASAEGRRGTLTISTETTPSTEPRTGSGWVVVSLSGSGPWQHCPDEDLALACQIIEQQGGRVVWRAQPETTGGQLSVRLRAFAPESLGSPSCPAEWARQAAEMAY